MKSNSNVKPEVFQNLGNGAWHYNYNVVETEVEDAEQGAKTAYEYDTVKIWKKPSYDALVKAVIREELDETAEFSLINDYNAAQFGITEDKEAKAKAIADYKAYLSHVSEIKAMVKADLTSAGL